MSLGFAQASFAGVIDTHQYVAAEKRQVALSEFEARLARDDVADQLLKHGVESSAVMARVNHLTTSEIVELNGQIDEQIAGGGVIGVVGAVFIVLIILELVGVTDVFKSF